MAIMGLGPRGGWSDNKLDPLQVIIRSNVYDMFIVHLESQLCSSMSCHIFIYTVSKQLTVVRNPGQIIIGKPVVS